MELAGRTCVVTGAAGGIGRALARRFHAGGAQVLVTDLDGAGAQAVAAELDAARPGSAVGVGGDVAQEPDVVAAIERARRAWGTVDLYWANAGVGVGGDLETPDDVWDLAWSVNTKAHYYAARHLVPEWLERGEGYFCSTASAAGLLTQIGSAPYALTKHAAVALAEWLAVTYGDRGLRVSCLCPQGVNTNMLNAGVASAGAEAVRAGGAVLEPDDVAEACAQAVADERFLVLPHPEVLTYWQRKTNDVDRWLAGMRRLQARVGGG
jgi:NAD(P)-dependent dehydrogenase (short-subunit alcohol dehydrogenase family)